MKIVSYERISESQQPNEHEKIFVKYLLNYADRDTLEILVSILDTNKAVGNYNLKRITEGMPIDKHNISPEQWERAIRTAHNIIKGGK